MDADCHISLLLAQLRLEHFLVYLPDNGWSLVPETRADSLRFELPDGDAPYVLMLPSSCGSTQEKRRLQKAVYNLSGIEDRQPVEVARRLLASDLRERRGAPLDVAPGSANAVRLRLSNLQATPLAVRVALRAAHATLMPGEAIEILCHPSKEGLIEIEMKGAEIPNDDLFPRKP